MVKKMTIDILAQITANEFVEMRKEIKEVKGGLDEVKELVGTVLEVVKSIDEGMVEIRTIKKVDIPQLQGDVDILEMDMKKVKQKVRI